MRTVTGEVEINASPEQVWAVLSDFKSYPEWNPMTPTMKGELREGAKLKGALGVGKRGRVPFFPKLLTAQANTELRWAGGVPGVFVADHRMIVEDAGDGVTRLRHHEEFTGIAAVTGIVDRTTEKVHAGFDRAIKRRVEATA